jgi:hypothetical protein
MADGHRPCGGGLGHYTHPNLDCEVVMLKKYVKLGGIYDVKVSGVITRVRLDNESPYGGWNGTNINTDRQVRIKTAGRLRKQVG